MNPHGHDCVTHGKGHVMSMSKLEKIAFTFGAGVVTGAVLALLYTPLTGKKLQKKVADVADKVIDKVDDIHQSVRKIARA